MKNNQKKGSRGHAVIYALLLVAFFWVGFTAGKKRVPAVASIDEIDQSELGVFWEAWEKVEKEFPFDDEEPSSTERIHAATAGMVRSFGDPYTEFLSPDQNELFTQDIAGEFGGIGLEIGTRDGILTAITPLKGSPAEKAGVVAGDLITQIDGEPSAEWSTNQAVSAIRGPIGETVTLALSRSSRELEVDIIRDLINLPVLEARSERGVGVIEVYSFAQNSHELFVAAIEGLYADGVDDFIIDLRGNPGGLLGVSIDMTSTMLPEGEPVVVEREGSSRRENRTYRSKGLGTVRPDSQVVILIDQGSASASEIMAGALQEHDRATLIGKSTFGKGSVQQLFDLSDDSSVKVTVSRWFTPSGLSISESGLTPDIEVEFAPLDLLEAAENIEDVPDGQLERAFEFLEA